MFHPERLQDLFDLALEEDNELRSNNASKIELEADLELADELTPEEVFIKTINFAKKHGSDISKSGLYKVESAWNVIIFLAESEEEVAMRIEEAIRS